METTKPVLIFTDGACSGNPGPGGWGAVLVSPLGKVKELGGSEKQTTNNRMEMTAALEAILSLSKVKTLSTKEIRLYTDSQYLIKGITGWIFGWSKNGWKTAEGKDVTNRDLWEKLLEAVRGFEIQWLYVPGHEGVHGNERCDQIAVAYSKGEPVKLFQGARADYPIEIERLPASSSGGAVKKKKPVYLSYVNGQLHRDSDWKSCEARVKGKTGVKFKKVESEEEESSVLKSWGLS
jgi:ribonuclease HI